MDKCKRCGSDNLVKCRLIGYHYLRVKNPKRMISSEVSCVTCSDCGEIDRLFATNPERLKNK